MPQSVDKPIDTAFILAAGRGERMRPLTDLVPKPLLQVGGQTLLDWHLQRLIASGIQRIVVNHAHLGSQIVEHLQRFADNAANNGAPEILLSAETEGGLETAGGIIKALPLLDRAQFLVINADVWTDYDYAALCQPLASGELARLVLVDTPSYKERDDFYLDNGCVYTEPAAQRHGLTFAGISLLDRRLFAGLDEGIRPLAPLLRSAMAKNAVSGEHYRGEWRDIGTPERLKALRKQINALAIEP